MPQDMNADAQWNELAGQLGMSLENDDAENERVLAGHERDMRNTVVEADRLDPAARKMIEEYRSKNGHQPVNDYGWLAKTLDVPAQAVNGLVDAVAAMKDLTFDIAGAGARTLYVDGMGIATNAEVNAEIDRLRGATSANALADKVAPGMRGNVDLAQPFGAPKSAVGNVTESLSQFLAPFAALGKVKYLQALGKAAPVAQGMLADFVAFDEHEKRLSNVINEMGWGNAVTEYLAADPNDAWAEGRFKNVLEGAGLGALTGAVFHGVKYIRDGKAAKTLVADMRAKAAPRAQEIRAAAGQIDGLRNWVAGTLRGDKVELPAEMAPAARDVNPTTVLDRYLDVTHKIEGTAKNPTSSAVGPFQFVDSTWLEEARLVNPALKDMPDEAVLAMRKDPANADFVRQVGKSFTQRNVDYLTAQGVENVDEPTMYLAHFLGKGDAAKVLKAADDMPVKGLVDDASIKANKSILAGKTVGQVKQWAKDIYAKRAAQVGGVGPAKAPGAAETVVLDGFRPNKETIDMATQRRMALANGTSLEDLKAGKVFEWARERGLEPVMNKVTLLEEQQFNKTAEALQDYMRRADMGDASAADEFWRNEGAAFLEVAGHARDVFQSPGRVMGFRGNTKAIAATNEILQRLARASTESKEDLMRAFAEMTRPEQVESLLQQMGKKTRVDIARESVHEWYINAILSSPKTQLVDTAGSAIWTPWLALEKVPAALVGTVRKGWFGGAGDQVYADEALVMLKSYFGSIADGFSYVANAMKRGEMGNIPDAVKQLRIDNASKFDDEIGERAISAKNWGLERETGLGRFVDHMGSIINWPASFMRGKDDVVKSILYRAEVRALAYRKAVSEGLTGAAYEARVNQLMSVPLDKVALKDQTLSGNRLAQIASGLAKGDDSGLVGAAIEDQAKQFAREGTFTDELGETGKAIQTFLNRVPGGRVVVPFIKTPTKIMVRFLERSPLAPIFRQVREDIAAGGARADMALGRMAAGSSVMGLGWYLASAGLVTGEGPRDPGQREALLRTGWRPRSIKVGDKYIEYGRYDPLASLLNMPANIVDMADALDNDLGADLEKDVSDYFAIGALAFTKMMMSKTWTQSIAELVDAVNRQDENGVQRMLQFYAASFAVPNAVTFFGNEINPVVQEANSAWEAIQIKAGNTVRPKLDIFGDPIKRDPQLYYGLPSSYSNITTDPFEQKLAAGGVFIERPTRRIEGVELSRDEYAKMMGFMKEFKIKDEMRKVVEGPMWEQLPDAAKTGEQGAQGFTKSGVMSAIYSKFVEAARQRLVAESPDLQARILKYKQALQTAPASTPGVQRALEAQGFDATGGPVKVDFGLGRAP